MPRKTLRKKQARRRTRKVRGGATHRLPHVPATFEEFDWDLKFVMGHGELSGDVFRVPGNTYILNLATAGRACSKSAFSLENIIYELKPPRSGRKLIYEQLRDGRFLSGVGLISEGLYKPGRNTGTEAVYRTSDVVHPEDASGPETSIAIYEPDDIMADTTITFDNSNLPYVLMGAYTLPIPRALKLSTFSLNKLRGAVDEGYNADTYDEDAFLAAKPVSVTQKNEDNRAILVNPYNLLLPTMQGRDPTLESEASKTFQLSEIIPLLGPVPAGRNRLILVRACRVPNIMMDDANGLRARRLSISARRGPLLAAPAAAAAVIAAVEEAPLRNRLNFETLSLIRNALNVRIAGLPAPIRADATLAVGTLDTLIGELRANRSVAMNALYGGLAGAFAFLPHGAENPFHDLATILNF